MNLKNISANKKNEMIKIHTSGYCYCHRRFNALGGKGDKTHQRVIMTRWWSFWGVERERNGVRGRRREWKRGPTSHYDSLVVVLAGIVGGKGTRPTNESLRLVGGV